MSCEGCTVRCVRSLHERIITITILCGLIAIKQIATITIPIPIKLVRLLARNQSTLFIDKSDLIVLGSSKGNSMKTHFHSPKTHFGVDFMDKLATVAATTTTTTANHNNKLCFHVHVDESCAEHTQQNTHTNTHAYTNGQMISIDQRFHNASKESKTSCGVTGAGPGV